MILLLCTPKRDALLAAPTCPSVPAVHAHTGGRSPDPIINQRPNNIAYYSSIIVSQSVKYSSYQRKKFVTQIRGGENEPCTRFLTPCPDARLPIVPITANPTCQYNSCCIMPRKSARPAYHTVVVV